MATKRRCAGCGAPLSSKHGRSIITCRHCDRAHGEPTYGQVEGYLGTCSSCRGNPWVVEETGAPCHPRCFSSTGPNCECRCHGDGHGTPGAVKFEQAEKAKPKPVPSPRPTAVRVKPGQAAARIAAIEAKEAKAPPLKAAKWHKAEFVVRGTDTTGTEPMEWRRQGMVRGVWGMSPTDGTGLTGKRTITHLPSGFAIVTNDLGNLPVKVLRRFTEELDQAAAELGTNWNKQDVVDDAQMLELGGGMFRGLRDLKYQGGYGYWTDAQWDAFWSKCRHDAVEHAKTITGKRGPHLVTRRKRRKNPEDKPELRASRFAEHVRESRSPFFASLVPAGGAKRAARAVGVSGWHRHTGADYEVPLGDAAELIAAPEPLQLRFDAAEVAASIGRLSQRDRDLVRLIYFEDKSHEEAARQLGMTTKAAKQAIHRARRNIQKDLEAMERKLRRNPELLTLLGNPIKIEGPDPEHLETFGMAQSAAAALRYAQEVANREQKPVKVWKLGNAFHLTPGARSTHEGVHYATATPDAPPRRHSMRKVRAGTCSTCGGEWPGGGQCFDCDRSYGPRKNPDRMTWHKAKVVGKKRRETAKQLRAAEKAYRRFHGVDPATVKKVPGRAPVLVALGQLKEVVYQPTRGVRKGPAFFHVFGKGATLAATPDGKHLILVPRLGKPFKVKWDRGIVG